MSYDKPKREWRYWAAMDEDGVLILSSLSEDKSRVEREWKHYRGLHMSPTRIVKVRLVEGWE